MNETYYVLKILERGPRYHDFSANPIPSYSTLDDAVKEMKRLKAQYSDGNFGVFKLETQTNA